MCTYSHLLSTVCSVYSHLLPTVCSVYSHLVLMCVGSPQIHSLNVTIKEKNCLLSDLDWQLTTKDYTINLLQKDRERQGVAVGGSTPMDIPRSSGSLGMKGSGPIDNAHSKLMSPTSLLTASDEYQHVR